MSMVGLFDSNWFNESMEITAEEDAMMESVIVEECACDPEDGFMLATLENEQNYYNLMNAIAMNEMQEYIRTGSEIVYEAGQITKVMNSIKAWIKKAWEKVKAVFKKVGTTISGWVRSDKNFIEKYGDKIKAYNPANFKFKGFDVSLTKINSVALQGKLVAAFKKEFDYDNMVKTGLKQIAITGSELDDNAVKSKIEAMRQAVAGVTKEDEFEEALKKQFGIDKSQDLDNYDGAMIVDEIKNAKAAKSAADKAYKDSKMFFSYLINLAKNVEKHLKKVESKDDAKNAMKPVSKWNEGCRAAIAMSTRINKVQIKAINIMHSQAKAKANYAIRGAKNESFGFDDDDTLDFVMV